MNKQDLRFEALETLVADGQREIIRRLAWLEENRTDGVAQAPGLDDWIAGLDRHLLLQRAAFVKTIRTELPSALIATARTMRFHVRILSFCTLLNLALLAAQLLWSPVLSALVGRL